MGTEELAAFLVTRKQEGLNAASLRITTVHLKIFFRWLALKGRLEMDPAEPLLAPRPDQTLPETLHAREIGQLLESIDPSVPLGRRDRAILELFYASGLRLSELCNLRFEMMDLEDGFLRITGKGNKTRVVRVGSKAREAIADYLARERPQLVTKRTSSHLFLSVRGEPPFRPTGSAKSSRNARNSRASTKTSIPTCCATRSRPICWKAARICGSSRSC